MGATVGTVSLHTFFSFLFSGVPDQLYTTLQAFAKDRTGGPLTKTIAVANLEEGLAWIEQHRYAYDLYFRPSLLAQAPIPPSRGKESDTVGAIVVWSDLDIYKVAVTEEEAIAFLQKGVALPPPSVIVCSGGGLQAYWKLTTFCRDILSMKGRNRWIRKQLAPLGADDVSDYARVLRIPETFNYKKSERRPTFTRVFESTRLYTLGDFGWLPPPAPVVVQGYTPASVLSEDFLETIETQNAHIARLIFCEESARQEHAPLADNGAIDNSRNDYAIARGLLHLGYKDEDIIAVLTHAEWLSGRKFRETGRMDYVIRTLAKAKSKGEVDVERFFKDKKFIPLQMLEYLLEQGAHFLMHNMEIWVYDAEDGVYRPSGEAYIRHEVAILLGKHWKSSYANETVTLCYDTLYNDALEELRNITLPPRTPLERVWLNTRTGMVNLGTGEIQGHTPDVRSLVQIPAYYATHVTVGASPIERFVADILQADCINAWWEWVGYHFLNDTRFRRALMVVGERLTGKSTLLNLLDRFLGPSNTTSYTLQSICDERFSASGLVGKIANIYNDLDMVELKHAGNLKVFISGERVTVERKYQPAYETYLTAKHSYSANAFVPVADPDNAFVSRWLVMKTERRFTEGGVGIGDTRADVALIDKLGTPENMSIMLGLAIDGLRRLCAQEHFSVGASMQQAQDEFHASLDSVFAFLVDCTERDYQSFTPKQALYDAYQRYCGEMSRGKLSNKRFFQRLADLARDMHLSQQRKSIDGKQVHGFNGLRLLPTAQVVAQKKGITIVRR